MRTPAFLRPLAAALALGLAAQSPAALAAEKTVLGPAPAVSAKETGMRTAILAGGCFWGIEGVFSHVKGVSSAVSGYHGGSESTATYERTNRGDTGHAEAVRVRYDSSVIGYEDLLRIFFSVAHDPTQLNRQGPDRGSQYRSAIVPVNADQRRVARAYIRQLEKSGVWGDGIVTRVEPYKAFYAAEEYHQDYMRKNPRNGYIRRWDLPKVEALKQRFPARYRASFKTD